MYINSFNQAVLLTFAPLCSETLQKLNLEGYREHARSCSNCDVASQVNQKHRHAKIDTVMLGGKPRSVTVMSQTGDCFLCDIIK